MTETISTFMHGADVASSNNSKLETSTRPTSPASTDTFTAEATLSAFGQPTGYALWLYPLLRHVYGPEATAVDTLADNETMLYERDRFLGVIPGTTFGPRILASHSSVEAEPAWFLDDVQAHMLESFETCYRLAKTHLGGDFTDTVTLILGCGDHGRAQAQLVKAFGGVSIVVDVDREVLQDAVDKQYVNVICEDMHTAIATAAEAKVANISLIVGVHAHATNAIAEALSCHLSGDLPITAVFHRIPLPNVTDFVPRHIRPVRWRYTRLQDSVLAEKLSWNVCREYVESLLAFQDFGALVFDLQRGVRQIALERGVSRAAELVVRHDEHVAALRNQGASEFSWVLLGGRRKREAIKALDATVAALRAVVQPHVGLETWLSFADSCLPVQRYPARTCYLGFGQQLKVALALNALVRDKVIDTPIAIGVSPFPYARETGVGAYDASAVALYAMAASGRGADWVHVGSKSLHYVILADGSQRAEDQIRVLFATDPSITVLRRCAMGDSRAQRLAVQAKIFSDDGQLVHT
ncbi:NAD-binding protein [Corynebacterium sp. HS2168-gen11]|uniref:NAD-binding protein n=1 Tax=Corynebacterium sp. HS2168-gen11 TaxID=2974027 RepID=UPI00216B5C2A|nr:NAD-binding protein [Corynebacterium sp. HS2168-gen11]MCS4535251.1 hypothetical protein [Corynebacterium sp. HS2168-gen11]